MEILITTGTSAVPTGVFLSAMTALILVARKVKELGRRVGTGRRFTLTAFWNTWPSKTLRSIASNASQCGEITNTFLESVSKAGNPGLSVNDPVYVVNLSRHGGATAQSATRDDLICNPSSVVFAPRVTQSLR
jgi:hypothetical protein